MSNASQLQAALSNLRPGDLVKATTAFTVNGSTVIRNRLAAPAELDLTGVSFVFSGGFNAQAVLINNAKNLYIYGGDLSTADTGGTCLTDHGSQHVRWWGFNVHDCGGSGFAAFTAPGSGPVDHDDFQGTITRVGQTLAWDPHSEKGTGVHGAILWDAQTRYAFTHNRFAFYAHDIPTGACVELGNEQPASQAGGNVLYEKCVNETEVAKRQTGGNGLQLWGDTDNLGLDVKYLEVVNAQGRALETGGIDQGQSLAGVTVEYGRATNTNLNPRFAGQSPWDSYGGVVYSEFGPLASPAQRSGVGSPVQVSRNVLPARSRTISRACRTLPGSVAVINLCGATQIQCRYLGPPPRIRIRDFSLTRNDTRWPLPVLRVRRWSRRGGVLSTLS